MTAEKLEKIYNEAYKPVYWTAMQMLKNQHLSTKKKNFLQKMVTLKIIWNHSIPVNFVTIQVF